MAKTRFVNFERKSFVPTENLVGFVPTEILVPCSYVPACIPLASLPKARQSFLRALKGEQGQLSNGSQLWLRSAQSRPDQQKSESCSKWLKQVLSTLNKSPILAITRFVHFERKSCVPTEILVPCSYVPASIPRASSPNRDGHFGEHSKENKVSCRMEVSSG